MPQLNVTATADCIVNYQAGYPQGPANGVLICYGREVSMTQIMPPSPRGKPRTDYARVVLVAPQEATLSRWLEICRDAYETGSTVTKSYDDAGVGDLSQRKAILYDISKSRQLSFTAWYEVNYPGAVVVFA